MFRSPDIARPARLLAALVVLFFQTEHALAQPANDNPCSAVVLTPNLSCVNTTGTNVAATATSTTGLPAPGCAGYGGGDVWYQVTVPASGQVTATTSTVGGSFLTDSGIAFYTAATCAGPFTLAGCDNNSGAGNMSQQTYIGAPGTVLWIRVWENGNNSFGSFNICITAPPNPPVNNDPCAATSVSVSADCSFINYTNAYATNTSGFTAPGCGSFGGTSLDVWFTFIAPASGIVILETQAGTLTDAAMALYYDAPPLNCAGPFTLVQCDDNAGPGNMPYFSFTGLVPGGTYYLRVWGSGSTSGTFDLCVHGPASVPAGGCVYMLELFDSFGNGWGSSSVGISINGGAFTSYSLSGAYNIILLGMNIGDILVIQYTASGPNQTQNSYELSFFPSGNNLFVSGSPPAAGITFTQTIDCVLPIAPQQDCVGSATICNAQAFNNNSNNTGNVVDLNSTNRGCLASNERQGTWYAFSPSASGTIGFTIAPTVTTDYDFAVWGPYPPGSTPATICPPAAAPLRCSYSALQVNTGCGNGAADLSEGALGNAWVSTINATVGQVYLLYIDNYSTNGQAFTLSWQLTAGASLDCTVLPIELLSFGGEAHGSGIDLHWSTATETDNDHFVMERMEGDELFTPIGTVPGAGTTLQQSDYHLTDGAPHMGMNYYRLMQVDVDGHYEHSQVIGVRYVPASGGLLLFPNPGEDEVSINTSGVPTGSALSFMDATGREVLRHLLDGEGGSMSVTTLPRGFYTVRLIHASGATLAHTPWVKR